MALTADKKARKNAPMDRGLLAYFPNALAGVAELSRIGNEQHNPGEDMYWARDKSNDHGDCIIRHQADWDQLDEDGMPHCAKVAWRALAQYEEYLIARGATPGRGTRATEKENESKPSPPTFRFRFKKESPVYRATLAAPGQWDITEGRVSTSVRYTSEEVEMLLTESTWIRVNGEG